MLRQGSRNPIGIVEKSEFDRFKSERANLDIRLFPFADIGNEFAVAAFQFGGIPVAQPILYLCSLVVGGDFLEAGAPLAEQIAFP